MKNALTLLAKDVTGNVIQNAITPEPAKTFIQAYTTSTLCLAIAGGTQLASLFFSGLDEKNSNNGIIYWGITEPSSGVYTVTIYKDSAGANAVASGTRTGNGAITLSQLNASGLSGGVTITFTGEDVTYSANTITMPRIKNRIVRLQASTACHVLLGNGNLTASATADMPLVANLPEIIDCKSYSSIAVVQNSAGGNLFVTPLL